MLALGYALLHSLWQGVLVGLGLLFALSLLPFAKARLRYAAACTALVCILGLPLLSFYDAAPTLETPPTFTEPAHSSDVLAAPVTVLRDSAARVQQTLAPSYSEQALRWFVRFWALGVVLLCLRFGLGYILSRRLRHCAVYAAPHAWAVSLAKMSKRLELTPPRLLLSVRARVPLVIGYLKPVILLPVKLISSLSAEELELILAHELAHIKRHDYLVNLLQSLAEILLFYHPVAWWINRVIRQEREHCCDDLALSVTEDARAYAKTLLKLETLKSPSPSLAATGGNLMTRFKRLAEPDAHKLQPTKAALSLVLVLGGVLAYFNFGTSQTSLLPSDESTRARLAQEIKDGFDIASPFENIRWNYRDETQVQVDGSWYDLMSINEIAEQDLVTFTDRTGKSASQKICSAL